MNEYTLSKIEIHKADPRKWQASIFKIVPKNQLPGHFGGTLTDPDGNPRLISKVIFLTIRVFLIFMHSSYENFRQNVNWKFN